MLVAKSSLFVILMLAAAVMMVVMQSPGADGTCISGKNNICCRRDADCPQNCVCINGKKYGQICFKRDKHGVYSKPCKE